MHPDQQRDFTEFVARLPENTPEQLRVVRECMPNGGPVHNMDGNRRLPEQGSVEDFRVLAEYRDKKGMTALVGSLAGFVLCTPTTQKDMAERAIFTYWGFKPPGDLTGFQGDLQADAYTSHTHSYATGPQRIQHDDAYRVVVGRVTSGVRRTRCWGGRRTWRSAPWGGGAATEVVGKKFVRTSATRRSEPLFAAISGHFST
ncbi:hypothetical protein ACFPOI_08625 [Nonomuraea angiospora]|uniref:Uncharacterized protein n=1 Tax=Nonomuraea angiospora TaxID=46172 RepID=A0ABR9MHD4_9ACTN|nr:hypothetical protein [Nonomuraea angiospora]MBE1591943.1 hypothetical protein [Nonomuraea angiospora]